MTTEQTRRLAKQEARMDMTPMIDVTFLLLIFFMCTLQFRTLEGKLAAYLPRDVGPNPDASEPQEALEVTLRVLEEGARIRPAGRADGRYELGPDRRLEYAVGPRRTTELAVVAERLRELHRAGPERPVTLDARPGVVHGEVVGVLDAALNVGFTDITFVGSYED